MAKIKVACFFLGHGVYFLKLLIRLHNDKLPNLVLLLAHSFY